MLRLGDWFSRFAIDLSPLRDYPHFRRLWLGQSISFIGGEITIVAMPFQVYELTHSTLALGLFSLTQLVPLLTLTAIKQPDGISASPPPPLVKLAEWLGARLSWRPEPKPAPPAARSLVR